MNILNETITFTVNPDVVYTQIDDEAVLMGIVDEMLYGINCVGTEILQQLELQPMSVQTMSSHLLTQFEVNEVQCREDTKLFFQALLAEQIIIQQVT